jgi:hypothetical protein
MEWSTVIVDDLVRLWVRGISEWKAPHWSKSPPRP